MILASTAEQHMQKHFSERDICEPFSHQIEEWMRNTLDTLDILDRRDSNHPPKPHDDELRVQSSEQVADVDLQDSSRLGLWTRRFGSCYTR